MSVQVHVGVDEALDLGESPVRDPIRYQVLRVGIRTGRVLAGVLRPEGAIDVVERSRLPGTVGAVTVSAAGEWLPDDDLRRDFDDATGTAVPGPDVGRIPGSASTEGTA